MPRTTPFHPRTAARCGSFLWKEWSGYAAVRAYDAHSEEEYFAVRHKAGVIDVSPLCKYDLSGPDAAKLLSRVFTRNPAAMPERRVAYGLLCDDDGCVLDDGTLSRIGPDRWRLCTSERWGAWLHRHARRLDVRIDDTTEALAALAVQGPLSRKCLAPLVDFEIAKMPYFRVRPAKIAGVDGWISRTGFTGDLGYELFVPADQALRVWDALFEAGAPHQLAPFGLDALDVLRIEAGFVIQGVDYFTSRTAAIPSRKSTPDEIGLGGVVDLEDRLVPFVGQAAVVAERARGSRWDLVALALDWAELERLYQAYGLPPHLAPAACRNPVPVYAEDGRTQVGQVTSQTWSPVLKQYLCLATVQADRGGKGTPLRVEHTVDYERRTVLAHVVDRPAFDPARKRSVGERPARNPTPAPVVAGAL
ncbi:MAG: aminomethyltransferase family protein [Myxococcota bacterium]